MLVHSAEESFRQGMIALQQNRHIEALALFEAAIELERRLGTQEIQPRYLSYYGLCLSLHGKRHRDGVYFCREATAKEQYNADLFLNLGRACLAAGRRREAHDALERGLRLQPGHDGIQKVKSKMGSRRRPVIPFLSRDNPVNIVLGKLASQSNNDDESPVGQRVG